MKYSEIINRFFKILLSDDAKKYSEQLILGVAIVSYLVHLLIIFLNWQGVLELQQKFFTNPIAAIYTPFSFKLRRAV